MTYKAIRIDGRKTMYGVSGKSPGYETVIARPDSGQESREGTREQSLGRWTFNMPPMSASEFEDFVTIFRIVRGRVHTFAFLDPLDYICTTSQSRLVQLTSSTWQMYRRRTYGAYTDDQIIILPHNTTVAGGGSYSVNEATGVITKNSGANPTSFSTRYYKLCRFDTDDLEFTVIDKSRGEELIQWSGIPILEVPLSAA